MLGAIADLTKLVQYEINEVMIAVPSAHGGLVRRRHRQHCIDAGVRHRVLPTLGELVGRTSDVHANAGGPGRRPLGAGTGASGAAGRWYRWSQWQDRADHRRRRIDRFRALPAARQRTDPSRSCSTTATRTACSLLEAELRARFSGVRLVPILGDILLSDQLEAVFAVAKPEIVFHAAAYKHVPLAEQNVLEAVRNNILGTRNVAEAAITHGVKEFVLVSTDKAVRPTSVMGVTKRVAELVIQGCAERLLRLRGGALRQRARLERQRRSAIPRADPRGGPVTVTHRDVTRYFMTIPEALRNWFWRRRRTGEAGRDLRARNGRDRSTSWTSLDR